MTRQLADSTLARLRARLEGERDRLVELIEDRRVDLEEARLSQAAADRSPDPASAEAGSMAFEYEKELSVLRNSVDLLAQVEHALARLDVGEYGSCERCGAAIPVQRLEALPHTTLCVECASKR